MMRIITIAILFVLLTVISINWAYAITVGDGSVGSTVEINSSTTNGPSLANNDQYGISVANIGDLDGDGVNDIAVGSYNDDEGGDNRGAVHIHFMNTDGSVDSTVEINSSTTNGPTLTDGDNYGISVANIGDLDGDGVNDIAVGAYLDDEGGDGRGAMHIHFMNADGSVDSTVEINSSTTNGPSLTNGNKYGISVANIGDLDGDGVNDIAVGADTADEGGSNRGAVYIHFMNTDGSIDSTVEINSSTTNGPSLANEDRYGRAIVSLGDLDGDGVIDLAVGTDRDDGTGTDQGIVYIHFMNTDGSIDSTVEINGSTTNGPSLADNDWYGRSIANIGDLDGDGVIDIAVGAEKDDEGGDGRGTVYIHFMNIDGSVDSTVEINSSTTNGPSLANVDAYGRDIANIGDLDGDGVNDIVVGAYKDDEGGNNRGAIHISYLTLLTCATVANVATYNEYPTCGIATCNSGYVLLDAACTLTGNAILAPLPSTGGGANDFSISMNQTRFIDTLSPMGSNLLMYIWSKAEFLTRESGTNINQKHSVFLEHLDLLTNKITLAFTSDTVKETLSLGETKNVDLNNDAIDDITVTFSDLQYNRVEVTLVDVYTDTNDYTEVGDKEAPDDSFTRDLYVGVSGEDVKTLQKFLNTNGFMLTDEGLGSQGNETTFYGHLTRDALIQFQTTHDIFPTWGYFGPLTRDFIAESY